MKKLIDMMAKPGSDPSVQHYLCLLKFIASVPTIGTITAHNLVNKTRESL